MDKSAFLFAVTRQINNVASAFLAWRPWLALLNRHSLERSEFNTDVMTRQDMDPKERSAKIREADRAGDRSLVDATSDALFLYQVEQLVKFIREATPKQDKKEEKYGQLLRSCNLER